MADVNNEEQHERAEQGAQSYNADQIKVLKGLEAVRKRPGMYIGDTDDGTGLHHMVFEVVDNSIDEAIAGYCSQIDVTVHNDDSVTIEDNGRGIPVDMHPEEHRSAAEVIMTVLHAGGKFDHSSYKVSGGLHGVGVSVVNALSEQLILEIYRGGKVYRQEYCKGEPLAPLAEIGVTNRTGTKVTFRPDRSVFKIAGGANDVEMVKADDEESETPQETENTEEIATEVAAAEMADEQVSDVSEEEKIEDGRAGENIFKAHILQARLRQLAYLNAGIKITFTDQRDPNSETQVYCFEGGIREYVRHINQNRKVLNEEPIYIYNKNDETGVIVEACLQWNDGYSTGMDNTPVYTNNIRNRDGGTHLTGLRLALTNVFTNYIKELKESDIKKLKTQKGPIKKSSAVSIKGEDVREGLVCVLSVKMPDPKFSSQTKDKLISSEITKIVSDVVSSQLGEYFGEHPEVATPLVEKSKQAAQVRDAMRKAQDLARASRKNPLDDADLPGKLTDCRSTNPEETELYLVEGLSAGGSAIGGRDSRTQAVLPLRGKILNVEKARLDRMLASAEIKVLIKALGTGIGSEVDGLEGFDITKLRYNKVVIMTDADVDGSHIRTLLLTFFFRQMPELIRAGHVYIAQPPLFKVSYGFKKVKDANGKTKQVEDCIYFKDEAERDRMLWQKAASYYQIRVLDTVGQDLFTGDDMLKLFSAYNGVTSRLSKMDHFLDKRVLEGLLFIQDQQHQVKDVSEEMLAAVKDYVHVYYPNLQLDYQISDDSEHNALQAMLYLEEDGQQRQCHLGYNFFHSPEFAELLQINEIMQSFRGKILKLELTGNAHSSFATGAFNRLSDLLEFAVTQVTNAQKISRYKGLGEMSPEQLKETTMDPANRTMLKVTIEDAEEADRTFSLLMGDAVEPRREFIEKNAKFVLNLDI